MLEKMGKNNIKNVEPLGGCGDWKGGKKKGAGKNYKKKLKIKKTESNKIWKDKMWEKN